MPFHPSLSGRTAVVTGASRGIGREISIAMAEAGMQVALIGSSEGPGLRDAVARSGDRCIGVAADVKDHTACRRAVDLILERFGTIDVLVNNAAVGMTTISERYLVEPPRFWEASAEACQKMMDTNVMGPINMALAIVPHMVARKFGKIINISTREQTMVAQGFFPYGPGKAALEAMSLLWSKDLSGTGVDVNVLLPGGATDTDLLPATDELRGPETELLSPSIMRAGILWLSSDESNGVTGRRFVARLWDNGLPASDAAERAQSAPVPIPAIM